MLCCFLVGGICFHYTVKFNKVNRMSYSLEGERVPKSALAHSDQEATILSAAQQTFRLPAIVGHNMNIE